jgi:hypothetical protein
MYVRNLVGLFVVVALSAPAYARPIKRWNYDKLSRSSDVVVVATAASTEDWDDPAGMPQLGEVVFKGQLTSFKIQGVLKGEVREDKLELVHYTVTANGRQSPGPGLKTHVTSRAYVADFRIAAPRKRGKEGGTPHYLLFLKRRNDGNFEPVSGQVDSANSVMLLQPEGPHLFLEGIP